MYMNLFIPNFIDTVPDNYLSWLEIEDASFGIFDLSIVMKLH